MHLRQTVENSWSPRAYLESIGIHSPEHIMVPIPGQDLEAFRPATTQVQLKQLRGQALARTKIQPAHRVDGLTWLGPPGESSQTVSRPQCPSLHIFGSAAPPPK
jgi:hypothetical protein